MQLEDNIANECRALHVSILSEDDARKLMQYCRRALGLGRTAVKTADNMSEADLLDVQETLRLAYRASRGTYNPNASITKLAKVRMARAGYTQLPIVSATRPKLISTDTASLAVSSKPLHENWFDTQSALKTHECGELCCHGGWLRWNLLRVSSPYRFSRSLSRKSRVQKDY